MVKNCRKSRELGVDWGHQLSRRAWLHHSVLAGVAVGMAAPFAGAQARPAPVLRTKPPMKPMYSEFDDIMNRFIEANAVPGATLAIMKGDRIVFSRAYGFANPDRSRRMGTDSLLRLASNDKPITKGAIKTLAAEGRLLANIGNGRPGRFGLDTRVFPLLRRFGLAPFVPAGSQPDPRIDAITVEHLVNHTSGLKNLPSAREVQAALGLSRPASAWENARWLAGSQLRHAPGSPPVGSSQYVNSGFDLARLLIDKVTGNLVNYLRGSVFGPAGTAAVDVTHNTPGARNPNEAGYATVNSDADNNFEGALTLVASAEAVVRYYRRYDMGSGALLLDSAGRYSAPHNGFGGPYFGRFDGTFTLALQHYYNQVSVAALLNKSGRYDALAADLNTAVGNHPVLKTAGG